MKLLKYFLFGALVQLCMSMIAFAQDAIPVPQVPHFAYIYFVPFLLGYFLHWAKKNQLDGLDANILHYWVSDPVSSIYAIIVGAGGLLLAVQMAPAHLYDTWNIGLGYSVFMLGFGSDSLNSASAKKSPVQP